MINRIASPSMTNEQVHEVEYRTVRIRGRFSKEGEVLITNRSHNGEPGYNIATPFKISKLLQDDSEKSLVVYVNRGWIPQNIGDSVLSGVVRDDIAPPGGYKSQRNIVGRIRANETQRILGDDKQVKKSQPVSMQLSSDRFLKISNTDADHMYPLWISLQENHPQLAIFEIDREKIRSAFEFKKEQTKSPSKELPYPVMLGDPVLTEGNHFTYAMQWILFGSIAIITWCIVCLNANNKNKKKRKIAKPNSI